MKRSTKQVLGWVSLTTVFLVSSCVQPTTNTNAPGKDTVATSPAGSPGMTPPGTPATNPCGQPIGTRAEAVQKAIADAIEGNGHLGYHPGSKPSFAAFKFDVQVQNDHLVMRLEGKIGGKQNGLPVLAALIKPYVQPAKCIEKIWFVPNGTIAKALPLAADNGDGFEWVPNCESPNVPCPNGDCDLPERCPTKTPDPSANTNANRMHN